MTPTTLWVSLAAGGAAAAAAVLVVRRAPRAAPAAAALILTQAAVLALVVAGPAVRYQHLRAPLDAWRAAPLAAAAAVAGALLGLVALLRLRGRLAARLRGMTGTWGMLAAAATLVAVAAIPSLDKAAWVTETVWASLLQAGAIGLAVAAAAFTPDETVHRLTRWLDPPDGGGRDPVPWVLALAVTAAAALLSILSYQRHPHIPDELSYLMQARYLAAGMLTMPAPPVPPAFELDLMMVDGGRWFSPFPVGWPAVLAAGVRLGVPWLVNPLLGGLNVLLVARLLAPLEERRTARLAVVLFASSPWHLFLAASFMSHVLSLALALAAATALVEASRARRLSAAFGSGLALGLLSLVRPVEGAALGCFLALAWLAAHGRAWRPVPLIAMGVGALAAGAAGLAYNAALTGDPLTFPVNVWFDRTYGPGVNALGFGANRGLDWRGLDPFPGHGPLDAVVNTVLNAAAVNTELFGWAAGSLTVVVLGMAARRPDRTAWLWMALVAAIVGGHVLYWFSGGPDFGARYWFPMIVPGVALAARALAALDPPRRAARARLAALLLTAAALSAFVPWRATDKYHHYRGMRPDLRALARTAGFGRSLVLVRGRRFPDYASAAAGNPVRLSADVPVYAWDRDAATRRAVVEAFPDRPVWVVEGPTVTGGGYRVAGGPFTGAARAALLAAP